MATNYKEPTLSDGEAGESLVTHCPLCQEPISSGSKDDLRLHYLTSCSNYDNTDPGNEEPKPKLSSHADARANTASARTLAAAEPPRVLAGPSGSGSSRTPVTQSSSKAISNVMFMWQPHTEMSFPSATLLASFQRGSVELTRDPEGGHYASPYVDIAKGSYEGQLVVGSGGFIHPVKEFSVTKDEEVVILQFNMAGDSPGDLSYDMQSNPSYGAGTGAGMGAGPGMERSHDSYSDKGFHGYGHSYYDNASSSSRRAATASGRAEPSGHYFSQGATSGRVAAAKSNLGSQWPDNNNQGQGYSTGSNKKLHIPSSFYDDDAGIHQHFDYHDNYRKMPDMEGASEKGGHRKRVEEREGSMREQLEVVTRERDRLRDLNTQLEATWRRRVQKLEGEVEEANKKDASGHVQQGSRNVALLGSGSSELVELKDRNAALQEQILEYERTIKEQTKMMQRFTGSAGQESRHLLDFSKKQQVEQAERFEEMKQKMEDVLKMHSEYITLSHTNINLASQLEDYQAQTKLLLQEIEKKDEEIAKLKEAPDHSGDRLQLELETMKQKCDGWRDEVERLLPLEEEAERLRLENVELSQQLAQMVEEGERRKSEEDREEDFARGGHDPLMEQLTMLRETRVKNEEEILRLREERSSILNENATLREGSQPQRFASLQKKYQELVTEVELLQEANSELNTKLQIATDDSRLRPIQDKMDRYKKERDSARVENDSLKNQVTVLSVECQSANEQLVKAEDEVQRLQEKLSKNDSRMRGYREERNIMRERVKELEAQLKEQRMHYHHASTSAVPYRDTTELLHDEGAEGREGLEVEHSQSPTRDYRHGSPSLPSSYAPDQYSLTSELRFRDGMSPTPSDDSISPSFPAGSAANTSSATATAATAPAKLRDKGRTSEAGRSLSKSDSLGGGPGLGVVEVRTKDGVVTMGIQKPSTQLNPKFKPRVIVKRSDGYEAGTLMYAGKLNDREMAGVYSEIRQPKTSTSSSSSAYDGTFKDGKRYFKCPVGHGVYVSMSKVYIEMESATV